jgi:hypothetical protein
MEFPRPEKGPLTDADIGLLCALLDDEFGEVAGASRLWLPSSATVVMANT